MKDFLVNAVMGKVTPIIGEMAGNFLDGLEAKVEASPNKWDDAALILVQDGIGPALDELWEMAKTTENKVDDHLVQFLASAFNHELN